MHWIAIGNARHSWGSASYLTTSPLFRCPRRKLSNLFVRLTVFSDDINSRLTWSAFQPTEMEKRAQKFSFQDAYVHFHVAHSPATHSAASRANIVSKLGPSKGTRYGYIESIFLTSFRALTVKASPFDQHKQDLQTREK